MSDFIEDIKEKMEELEIIRRDIGSLYVETGIDSLRDACRFITHAISDLRHASNGYELVESKKQ